MPDLSLTIPRHCVPRNAEGLSPLQARLLADSALIRIFSAPTGAGKSFAFVKAVTQRDGERRVLFVVPTRRLAQNLCASALEAMVEQGLAGDAEDATRFVALWSSDATAALKAKDPDVQIGKARIRQVRGLGSDHRFIVATPESVAFMLLHALTPGHGGHPFSLTDLVEGFDHIVFDEFHAIDPRGFGLCAALATICARTPGAAKVTFLSATPIEIASLLVQFGVPEDRIATGAETVITTARSDPDLRVLHGDVTLSFERHDGLLDLLTAHAQAVTDCIARGRQAVVIFDSLDTLLSNKLELARFFDRIGVAPGRRLAINSVDDRTIGAFDGLFVTDRAADPNAFDVLVATSSIEMGVTFRAGLIAMDPGRDALALVQRLGRVARGDEPGLVLALLDERRHGKDDWLRAALHDLAAEPLPRNIPIDRLLDIMLKSARERFRTGPAALASDAVPTTFRSMPQRAIWAAALFWHALERAQRYRGTRETLRAFQPPKTRVIAALLNAIAAPVDDGDTAGTAWAEAFLTEAGTLRDFAATMKVIDADGTEHEAVPLRLIESRPRLAMAPAWPDAAGKMCLHIDGRLNDILRGDEKNYPQEMCTVRLPNGTVQRVARKNFAAETVRVVEKLAARELSEAKRQRYAAACQLVRMSGIAPRDTTEVVLPQGAPVVLS